MKRCSLGFDLRINPNLQPINMAQVNQRLIQETWSPISADASVWPSSRDVESIWTGLLPNFGNPLRLAKDLGALESECLYRGYLIDDLWPVCVTSYCTNIIALNHKFGPGYFDDPPAEDELLTKGWRFLGFDIVQLSGLISGLKGCEYVEPTRSQFRDIFGKSLNEVGLFNDFEVATAFAEVQSMEISEHAPFVVVGLLTLCPLS